MARIRTIKPEFWHNEILARLPAETRLLAIALLNHADDHGYFWASAQLVRAACFPFDECSTNVRRSLDELSSVGWIERRIAPDGRHVGVVCKFAVHQRVDRPQHSKIKQIFNVSEPFDERSTNDRRMIDDRSLLEQGTGNREQGTGNLLFDCSSNDLDGGKGSVDAPTETQEPSEAETPESYTAEFIEFWSVYPRKTGKRSAFKAFKRAKQRATARNIIASAAEYARARDGCDPEFTMQAERWLNGDHWEDDRSSWRLPGGRQTRSEPQTDSILSQELQDAIESGVDFGF